MTRARRFRATFPTVIAMGLVIVFSSPALAVTTQESYEESETIPVPSPPMNLQAKVREDSETVVLTWDRPLLEGNSPVDQYRIYRNGDHIETVGSDVFRYVDNGVDDPSSALYTITAINDSGEGLPGVVYPMSENCIVLHDQSIGINTPECFKDLPIVGPIYEVFLHSTVGPIYENHIDPVVDLIHQNFINPIYKLIMDSIPN